MSNKKVKHKLEKYYGYYNKIYNILLQNSLSIDPEGVIIVSCKHFFNLLSPEWKMQKLNNGKALESGYESECKILAFVASKWNKQQKQSQVLLKKVTIII